MKTRPLFMILTLLPTSLLIFLTWTQLTPVQAAGFVVNASIDDSFAHDSSPGDGVCSDLLGACTLRAAIEEANALTGHDTITFLNPMTITINVGEGDLPPITDTVTIDASSVWDTVNSRPGVTLDGNNTFATGLLLRADHNEIYGLYIHNFKFGGIAMLSSNNTIGNTGIGQRNIISGNGESGIAIKSSGAQNNKIWNNVIGLTPAGVKEPNNSGIVLLDGASNNLIGGDTQTLGNVIAGSVEYGAYVGGDGTDNNKFGGNVFGGTPSLGNTKSGINVHSNASNTIIGGPGLASNTIAGNGQAGIYFATISGTTYVENNNIYENSAGGIAIYGANVHVISNTISGNTDAGISINGAAATGNLLTRNRIYDNSWVGIYLSNGGNTQLAAPVVTTASSITGASGIACALCTVELFSDAADEGKVYEGTAVADAAGNWTFNGSLIGPNLTTTATDENNNSSRFSTPVTVTKPKLLFLPIVIKP